MPIILQPLTDKLVAINSTVTFLCLFTVRNNGKNHRISIEWFYNGKPFVPLLLSRFDRQRIKILNNK